ncbi:MAG: hypothetical protein IJ511_02245 [Bacteroides sp.]|nr:hypothetical protein [Bacteroides sp.]
MKETIKSPGQIYDEWKNSLRNPDDSIFYYHPSLERIILGLAMYAIVSHPYLSKLKKAEALSIYNIYINEMVTAWIDETEQFEHLFTSLMTLCEAYNTVCQGFAAQHPGLKKTILHLQYTFCYWIAVAGDMNEKRADELLDDISTDGKRIDSDIISQLAKRIQPIVISKGEKLDPLEGLSLIENA